jgi:hypothetical protein
MIITNTPLLYHRFFYTASLSDPPTHTHTHTHALTHTHTHTHTHAHAHTRTHAVKTNARFYGVNLLSELDCPGEYFIDETAMQLCVNHSPRTDPQP